MRIILGVCGSISAYKSLDIARGLVKQGHQVRVILTSGGEKFVRPEVFGYLGCEEVYLASDDFNHKNVLHVDLAKWCDRVAIAPLSANFLSKIVRGETFDLLSSVLLALPAGKAQLYYPAMNTEMLSHPYTSENLEALQKLEKKFPLLIHPTESGLLACGDVGAGKLPTVEKIIETIEAFNKVSGKKILISTGATKAPLDSVRYLTNSASGVTGFHIAKEALTLGHEVTVVAGEGSTPLLELLSGIPAYNLIEVKTNEQMKTAVEKEFKKIDCYISSAAIGDIEFEASSDKIKKDQLTDSLPIKRANDILKGILAIKEPHQKVVGFAAETDLSESTMMKKLESKPVDLLVGTKVNNGLTGSKREGFANNEADYLLLEGADFKELSLPKQKLAHYILDRVLS